MSWSADDGRLDIVHSAVGGVVRVVVPLGDDGPGCGLHRNPGAGDVRPGSEERDHAALAVVERRDSDLECGGVRTEEDDRLAYRHPCLLYTSDAADDLTRVALGGRRI